MPRALIVHASRHGATAGIAERIGEVLRAEGIEAVVAPASHAPDPFGFDACIVGGGVYIGSWVKEGIEYLERYESTLSAQPVWLFSCGPLPGPTSDANATGSNDPMTQALGPVEGPGSGGRRKLQAVADVIGVRDHRIFRGAYDPNDPPKAMFERLVRMMPASKGILPAGDFREWDVIVGWAREIAAALREPATVG
ncbi:MAG TPA: flavodoxin domain-containing protein [Candidatus Limnocylindrales bacterium]|nr:flavodoxin domain-containing protein [Candidatus Limnocylindrales bacterium]